MRISPLAIAIVPITVAVSVVAVIALAAVVSAVALTVSEPITVAATAAWTRGIAGTDVRDERRFNVAIHSAYFACN